MELEQVERKYYEALLELSMGNLDKKSELARYWLELENYPEYKGATVLKTGEILVKILGRRSDCWRNGCERGSRHTVSVCKKLLTHANARAIIKPTHINTNRASLTN